MLSRYLTNGWQNQIGLPIDPQSNSVPPESRLTCGHTLGFRDLQPISDSGDSAYGQGGPVLAPDRPGKGLLAWANKADSAGSTQLEVRAKWLE